MFRKPQRNHLQNRIDGVCFSMLPRLVSLPVIGSYKTENYLSSRLLNLCQAINNLGSRVERVLRKVPTNTEVFLCRL